MPISISDIDKGKEENVDFSVIFKPHVNPVSMPCLLSAESHVSASYFLLSVISYEIY